MIVLSNDYKFDFGCASGAMAFHGNGWWWEQPWRWLGYLNPKEFTVIVKTLTYEPRVGNLRWYAPWRAVRLLPNASAVNAVGLTNPGFRWWLKEPYDYVMKKGYKVIVSIAPQTIMEAQEMAAAFNYASGIKGLQLNVSCPNVDKNSSVDYICSMANAILRLTKHPLLVKLAYQDNYIGVCKELDGKVDAFELINSIPFKMVYEDKKSPLSKYGYEGGVSGRAIIDQARQALVYTKSAGVKTPIISGGGIDSLEEVRMRESLGANGFVFGTVFIRKPWMPNKIIRQYRDGEW